MEACLAGSLGMWRSTLRDPARGLARELRRFLTYSHSLSLPWVQRDRCELSWRKLRVCSKQALSLSSEGQLLCG